MKWVKPSGIDGSLPAPASKSFMIRATAAAFLSGEGTLIRNPSSCDDALAALEIVKALGAGVNKEEEGIRVTPGVNPPEHILDCQESGLCMRMFPPIAALTGRKYVFKGSGSLNERPMKFVEGPLRQLGVDCRTENGHPPIHVQGPMLSGEVEVDGSISSQFLTGLLMALPLCGGGSAVQTHGLRSWPYVAMTLSVLDHFGVSVSSDRDYARFFISGGQSFQSPSYQVEGDWSGAAFLLIAGAVRGKVVVENLHTRSLQADRRILVALESAGARIRFLSDAIFVGRGDLKAFDFDATDCPDLFPPLAVLACCCEGRSRIYGVERPKHKESDRASVLLSELSGIGAKISIEGDRMDICGSALKGGEINSHNDHRIAMAGAVAGLVSEKGVKIQNWRSVSKSYPDFFEDLESIGGNIT